jgi:chitodextrinase
VNPSVPPLSVDLSLPKGTYQVGESIVIGYTVNRGAYVYICNVDPTGAVVLVFPNYREPNPRASAGAHSVPGASYTLTVSGATGGETLYAFAATSPLPNFPTSFGSSFPILSYNGGAFRSAVRQTMQTQLPTGEWADDVLSFTSVPAQQTIGTLRVTSSPTGASVTVDGNPSGATPVNVPAQPGPHTVALSLPGYQTETRQVTVTAGQVTSVAVPLTRLPTNQPPIATFVFSPASPAVGQAVTFDARGSRDSDGTIVSFAWDFGNGTTGSGDTVTHTFSDGMSYVVRLTVTDNSGATNSASRSVSVTSVLPPLGSLRGYWAFNEGAGTTASDSSGNGNTGTIYNAAWTTSADSSGALAFDGSTSYVAIANSQSLDPTSQLTVEAWVKPQTLLDTQKMIVDKASAYTLGIIGGEVSFGVSGPGLAVTSSGAGLAAGAWYHIAGVYDGASIRVYVNGEEKGAQNASGAIAATSSGVTIGRRGESSSLWFQGAIDEVRIHARALSPSEFVLPPAAGVPPSTGPTPPQCSVSESLLDFGRVQFGGTGASKTLTVTNVGGGLLNGEVLKLSCDDYTITPVSFSLGQGESVTLTITFRPRFSRPQYCLVQISGTCSSQIVVRGSGYR